MINPYSILIEEPYQQVIHLLNTSAAINVALVVISTSIRPIDRFDTVASAAVLDITVIPTSSIRPIDRFDTVASAAVLDCSVVPTSSILPIDITAFNDSYGRLRVAERTLTA
jgi:hypothetical protein